MLIMMPPSGQVYLRFCRVPPLLVDCPSQTLSQYSRVPLQRPNRLRSDL